MSGYTLEQHNPAWAKNAAELCAELKAVSTAAFERVHHIGSTSIAGMSAKPIIDLIPVTRSLTLLDGAQHELEALGYEWLGEFGLPGRRYLRRDFADGTRQVQLHCYENGSPEITRHLAFRDLLRRDAASHRAYAERKQHCLEKHPDDHVAYGDCKSELIKRLEATALTESEPK